MQKINVIDLLPESLKGNQDVIDICSIINDFFNEINSIKNDISIYARLDDDTMKESSVDALARTFHLLAGEGYRFAGTVEQKRELVRNALILHRTKGTKYAVERVCNILDMKEAKLTEWYEDDSEPYTFKINANAFDGLNEEIIRLLFAMVDEFKNVRSHVSVFEFATNCYGTAYTPVHNYYEVELECGQYLNDDNILNSTCYMSNITYTETEIDVMQQLDDLNELSANYISSAAGYLETDIIVGENNESI